MKGWDNFIGNHFAHLMAAAFIVSALMAWYNFVSIADGPEKFKAGVSFWGFLGTISGAFIIFWLGNIIKIKGLQQRKKKMVKEDIREEKREGIIDKRNKKKILKQNANLILKIISLIFAIIFTCLISNQIVQPLFSPRLANMEVTPLFIQNLQNDYLLVFKTTYTIDVPLIPLNRILSVKMPGYTSEYILPGSNTFLLGAFFEHNPYADIPKEYINQTTEIFLDKNDGSIDISLRTGAFDTKQITVNLYGGETVNINKLSIAYPTHYWWNFQHISPIYEYAVAEHIQTLGYARLPGTNYTFEISELKVYNQNDLEFRGYKEPIGEGFLEVCHDGIDWSIAGKSGCVNSDYCISVDLNPRETKSFLLISQSRVQEAASGENNFFNFTSQISCFKLWGEYEKFLNK